MIKDIIINEIDSCSDEMIRIASDIWNNPEMGWTEKKAVEWMATSLRSHGFDTETGAYGMPTAIRAVWGEGKPVVGFAAEYDCLPGLSQKLSTVHDPVVEGGIGHGCGHNLLGTGCLAACIGLKKAMEETGLKGTVIFYGCPAEEQLTGKGFMAKGGAFKECDFTLAWHPSVTSQDTVGNHTAVEGMRVEFYGRTSHAAGGPQDGRSALDALQLTNIGMEFLREHVVDDVRMHYTITDGGMAPNIVPDFAAGKYFIRALSRDTVVDTVRRFILCAEGAAHMTETEVKIIPLGGIYPTLQNAVIARAVQEARAEIPVSEYTEEELKFADEINRNVPKYKEGTKPLLNDNYPLAYNNTFGSTDYGDVEFICPGFQVRECTAASLTPGHSWMMTACSGSSIGMKGMLRAGKIMADAAYKIMADPALLAKAKAEFEAATEGRAYECPITDEVEWPYKD